MNKSDKELLKEDENFITKIEKGEPLPQVEPEQKQPKYLKNRSKNSKGKHPKIIFSDEYGISRGGVCRKAGSSLNLNKALKRVKISKTKRRRKPN